MIKHEIFGKKEKEEEKTLRWSINIDEDGEYVVKGYVLYGGQPTETKEISFTIGLQVSNIGQIIIYLFIFLIFIFLILYYIRRKKIALTKKLSFNFKKPDMKKLFKKFSLKRSNSSKVLRKNEPNFEKYVVSKPTKKRKIHIKRKEKKPAGLLIEKMSAKEIEDYVKGL